MRVWERDIDNHVKQKSTLQVNLKILYSLAWRQVTPVLCHKLKCLAIFTQINTDNNASLVLIILCVAMFNKNNHDYKPTGSHKTVKKYYNLKQDRYMTNAEYLKKSEIYKVV